MKEEAKSLFKRIWQSRDDLFLVFMFYIPQIIFACIAIMLIGKGASMFGAPYRIVKTLCKILIGVSPIIPCLSCWMNRDEYYREGGTSPAIMDILLGVWMATIVAAIFL